MDWIKFKDNTSILWKKYRYVLLILLIGIFLMLLPEEGEIPSQPTLIEAETKPDLQEQLKEILTRISGVGRVEVLLTQSSGSQMYYQMDEEETESQVRQKTVVITGADRAQEGLLRRIDPPVYLGAVVVCQGADSPAVRLAVVDAVASATGLSTDRITVLKMK